MTALIRWLWPLVALAGTIWAVWWLWFSRHDSTPAHDAELLVFIGGCYAIAIGFLLGFTRKWTLRALGQVATYAADAALYLGSAGVRFGWWGTLGRGEIDAIRASFVVGGCALVLGLLLWAVGPRRRRREAARPRGEMEVVG